MKKAIILICISMFLLNGCNQRKEELETASTELTYWTHDEMYKKYMEECVERYNSENDKTIQIITSVYSQDELDYKLWASLQTGIGAPDLVDIEQSKFGRYMNPKNNYLVPINTIIDSKKDEIIDLSYKKYQSKGFYYGIDYYQNNCVAFYNRDVLQKAGISPEEIITWEDFIKAGIQLREKEKIPILAVDYTDDILYEILIMLAGSNYCESDTDTSIDNAINIEILNELLYMVEEIQIATLAPTGEYFSYEFYNFFKEEKVGAIFVPFWYAAYLENYMPELQGKIYVAPLPIRNTEISGVQMSGVATAISIQCEEPILAKNFLRDTRFDLAGIQSAYVNLKADPITVNAYDKKENKTINNSSGHFINDPYQILRQIRYKPATVNLCDEYYSIASKMAGGVLFQVIKEKEKNPEQALQELAKEMVKDNS